MVGNCVGYTAPGAYGWGRVGTNFKEDSDHLYPAHIAFLSYCCCPFVPGDVPGGGGEPSQKGCLFPVGTWHPCLLPAIFKNCYEQKKEGEETMMRRSLCPAGHFRRICSDQPAEVAPIAGRTGAFPEPYRTESGLARPVQGVKPGRMEANPLLATTNGGRNYI